MTDIVSRIADILIGDHIELMNENARLRERLDSALGQNANLIAENKRLRELPEISDSFYQLAVADVERLRALLTRIREDEKCAGWHYDIDAAIDAAMRGEG